MRYVMSVVPSSYDIVDCMSHPPLHLALWGFLLPHTLTVFGEVLP